jgi:hypothetical protein
MPIDDSVLPDGQEPPADLTSLRLDALPLEALAARIDAAAAPVLARRSLREGVQQALARAAWPALLAAAAAMFAVVGLGGSTDAAAEQGLAAVGLERIVPGAASDVSWIEEQRAPTDDDLAQAIGLGVSR